MKKLIIAEKPSLARNVLNAIKGNEEYEKKEGYFEGKNFIVSYAFGHLFGLADVESYFPKTNRPEKWAMDTLPFFPEKFKFEIKKDPKTKKTDTGAKKQFEILKKLIGRDDVEAVVHCGDADREGEVIVRLILFYAKCQKPVYRLWLPEQTANTIRQEMRNLKPDSEYDRLYEEGLARTYMDWLYGINLTRFVTLKTEEPVTYNMGRVLTPIVEAIYERDLEIRNFIPVKYWKVESSITHGGEKITLSAGESFSQEDKSRAEDLCSFLNDNTATVKSVEKKERERGAGKLFSLSKLQSLLGKKYKMPMKESLEIVQKLYEAGYVTYPRTNTEYLAENEKGKVKKVLQMLSEKGFHVSFKEGKKIFNDEKIESHSALCPTIKFPEDLPEKEKVVYSTILNRYLAVFCSEKCIVEDTTVSVLCGDRMFKVKGIALKQKGFLQYENNGIKDNFLPDFKEGETLEHKFIPVQKETSPPQKYNTASLNHYLINPFRKGNGEENDDADYEAVKKGLGIGTEATRTGIISNAIACGYISQKNDYYSIEPKGEAVIRYMKELGIDMTKETTARMQQILKKVYDGEISRKDAIAQAEKKLEEDFRNRDIKLDVYFRPEEKVLGKCPKCGGRVVETKMAYSCENRECGFVIWKKDSDYYSKFFSAIGFQLKASNISDFLKKGKTLAKKLKSPKGKEYDAYILADFGGEYPNWSLEFPKKKKK